MRSISIPAALFSFLLMIPLLLSCADDGPVQVGNTGGSIAGTGGSGGIPGTGGTGGSGGTLGTGGSGGSEASCGNGIVEEDEECDEGERNSNDEADRCREDCTLPRCGDSVLDEGEDCLQGTTMACGDLEAGIEGEASCTDACEWDLSACWAPEHCLDEEGVADCSDPRCAAIKAYCPTCGDGEATGDELCDGDDLRGETCVEHGFPSGTLACAEDCKSFITTSCSLCGNAVVDEGEECDLTSMNGNTCLNLGYSGGRLTCHADCTLNTSRCEEPTCGDGIRNEGEDCDGDDLGGLTCLDFGFLGGDLSCDSCHFDLTNCGGPDTCGNGELDPGEECDDGNRVGNDGCGSDCLLETGICGATIIDLGQELSPIPGEPGMQYMGTVAGKANATSNSCQTSSGPDQVHGLFVEDDSIVHVMVESLDPAMTVSSAISTNCADPSAELLCNNYEDEVSKVEVGVDAGTQIYISVDINENNYTGGPYRLSVYLFPMARLGESCGGEVLCEPPYRCSSGTCQECPQFGPC